MAQDSFPINRLRCDAFDIRVVDRHIKAGRVTRQDLAKHLETLPDYADNADEFTVVLGEDDEEAVEA